MRNKDTSSNRSDETYDAIIIGSGAGGSAAAWRLTQRGLKVLILEAGPAYDIEKDYRLGQNRWEQSYFPAKIKTRNRQTVAPLQTLEKKWHDIRSWNHLSGDFVSGEQRLFGRYDHVIGVGGSTLHFTGEAHRMLPAAMRMQSDFGVAADWPLNYTELEPHYEIAENIIGVAGPAQDKFRPRRTAPPLPAHTLSYASQKLASAATKLNLGWQANHLAILSKAYDGRPACNYCANCGRGCPRKDKGSVDVTFLPKAINTGKCTIKTESKVLQLQCNNKNSIEAVVYKDKNNQQHKIHAPIIIVACGAVETPRLLLNSANKHAADGIANESGQVGKNFMETLSWYSSGLHPETLGSYRGLPSDSICWDFNAPDAIPGIIGGCRFSPYIAEADMVGPINYAQRIVGGWGKSHQKSMQENFGRILAVGAIGEQLPNKKSFIDLDADTNDSDGLPKARIHSHLTSMDLSRLSFMAKTSRELLKTAGVTKFIEEAGSYDVFHSTHVFGTCRMGKDKTLSVVDQWCRSHHWKNLYIVDASVFPSSGGGEAPSLTIEALAIRAADNILKSINNMG